MKFSNEKINANIYYYLGSPTYNDAEKNLHTTQQAVQIPFEESIEDAFVEFRSSRCFYLYHLLEQRFIVILGRLESLEKNYQELAQHLKELIESKLLRCIYDILIYKI